MNLFTNQNYGAVLKILAVFSSLTMMFISAQFSVDGFSIQQPGRMYMGWLLAGIIIIVELIFNYNISQEHLDFDNPENKRLIILLWAGAASYLYGIATNIVGIIHSGTNPNEFYDYIVPVALGVFLEVVPEPLMVWALLSKSKTKKEEKKQEDRKPHYVPAPRHQEPRKTFNLRDLDPDSLRQIASKGRG